MSDTIHGMDIIGLQIVSMKPQIIHEHFENYKQHSSLNRDSFMVLVVGKLSLFSEM